MTIQEQVDKLLEERALLMFGVHYAQLDDIRQDEVIGEAVSGFDPKLVDALDADGGE
jgi:hypothetical protein